MSQLVNATRSYNSLTNNGAVTHSTSLSYCLDMFFLGGASRQIAEDSIIVLFERAFGEDPNLAVKLLFWARDARQGAGEKRFFQVIMKHIAKNYGEYFDQLMIHVPEFGSWKDVFVIDIPNENSLNWLSTQLEESANANLLAKWYPRTGPWFVAMHKYLKLTPKEFRKKLVSMTNVVESSMCKQEWSEIDYSKVPSIAMNKYRRAFIKQDLTRMTEFIEDVHAGKAKINASVIYPYQLYQAINAGENESAVEAQWNAMPDYMADSTERILPLCDVSGSMSGMPMDISVSLGIYISERNKGIFKDAFITFSENPEMLYLRGSLSQRMRQMDTADWGYSTNLQAAFTLILDSAIRESVPENEMPTKLLIISDMEFNEASDDHKTNLDEIRSRYHAAGYTLPEIIFWNVNGHIGNSPAQVHDQSIGLVSGSSPAILKSVLKGKVYTPLQLMLDTIMVDRYARVRLD